MRHLFPRLMLAAAFMAVFAGFAYAQAPNQFALEVASIIHNPTQAEAGSYLVSNVPIGDGKKFDNDLDRISGTLYALAGTTTHDLIIIRNVSGVDLTFVGMRNAPNLASPPNPANISPSPSITASKPKYNNPQKPESIMPQNTMQQVWGFDLTIVVPAGSTVPLLMLRTQWAHQLDTSPRDYVVTFGVWEVSKPVAQLYTFNANLTIPSNTGGHANSACMANPYGTPTGAVLLIACGLVAILPRAVRKLRAR